MRLIACPIRHEVAVAEPGCVRVRSGPGLEVIAEIATHHGVDACDVAYARGLLVLAIRDGAQTTLHVVDPLGPTKRADTVLAGSVHVAAASSDHVLVAGATIAIVDVTAPALVPRPLAIRTPMGAAAGMGDHAFLIATAGILEEWDARARKPLRRLRFARPVTPRIVGGSSTRAWALAADGTAIEIVSLATRSARTVALRERPVRLAVNAAADRLVAIGADTRTAYVIDLVRPVPPIRIAGPPLADATWLGGHALVTLPLEGPPVPRPA